MPTKIYSFPTWKMFVPTDRYLCQLKDICVNWKLLAQTKIFVPTWKIFKQTERYFANLKDICHVEYHGTDPCPLGEKIKHLCIFSSHFYHSVQISNLNDECFSRQFCIDESLCKKDWVLSKNIGTPAHERGLRKAWLRRRPGNNHQLTIKISDPIHTLLIMICI